MDEPQMDELMDETRELFERVITVIKEDFEGYITASKATCDKDLQFYFKLSEKEKVFNIASAIMARTAAMYKIDIVKWVEELMHHNTGIVHRIEVFQALPLEIKK